MLFYGPSFENLMIEGRLYVDQVRSSDVTPLVTVLLNGEPGSGKSSVAATLALESGFPFVKALSPENFLGMAEQGKNNEIFKVKIKKIVVFCY